MITYNNIMNFLFSNPFHRLVAQSDVEAQLVLKRFIERGSSVTMQCEHNVQPKILYKVKKYSYIYNTYESPYTLLLTPLLWIIHHPFLFFHFLCDIYLMRNNASYRTWCRYNWSDRVSQISNRHIIQHA